MAALESGIITPTTTIRDQGVYTYYAYPQPKCWIYRQYGSTHGSINVSQAITESCNYFFYETGRLTGIETIDNYATQFDRHRDGRLEGRARLARIRQGQRTRVDGRPDDHRRHRPVV